MASRSKDEIQADVEASRLELVQMQKELADLEELVDQKKDDINAAETRVKDLEGELGA